ncbi:hypothetical protein CYJ22_00400 [Schaalia odontolytica]|uniref:Uncharacterized protein n=2 Tax=Schaalia odontolytica TaxID=1660 RepID=A0A2I1I2R4_9ACTO|nr:hypothetical protein CYJ22_00400 [Schaalia odontolytica]
MTTQVRSQSRGLRMSLLALTASASVVGGMFVSVAPAYSVDGIGDGAAQCVTASEEGASIIASSVVASGSQLHVEGAGWGPSSDDTLGFVIVTLDDGQERRPDDVVLPSWAPVSVARNKAAWSVAKVDADGAFSVDLDLPASWTVGSSHQVMIGDGVTGNYVQIEVTVVESSAEAPSCSLDPTQSATADVVEPSTDDTAAPTPDDAAVNAPADPFDPAGDDTGSTTNGETTASASSSIAPVGAQTQTSTASRVGDATSSASSPAPSSTPSSAGGASSAQASTSSSGGAATGTDPTPEPSTSSEQQSVSASQIGPKAHSEQQASNQAAREQESRLNGWILAGGGLIALLGAIVTVSIVRRPHGLLR